MSSISDFTSQIIRLRHKTRLSPKGWLSFNAPCCTHNGESADKRGRGGVKSSDDGVQYHCFNCQFKTGFTPGRPLSHKFRKLLLWLGASDSDVNRLVIEALRIRDLTPHIEFKEKEFKKISFNDHPLPDGALSFEEIESTDPDFIAAVNYASTRFGDLSVLPSFYWTPDKNHAMNKRVIIPYTWEGKIIGYTGRTFKKMIKPKYYNDFDSNYVYGTDRLIKDSRFVLVFEGPVDAMLMNGVAVLSNEVSVEQADIINALDKQVIVVPDQEKSGEPLINTAIAHGWHVSFPLWDNDIKDAGDAIERYGKLYTLKSIISNIATTKLKIELNTKRLNGYRL